MNKNYKDLGLAEMEVIKKKCEVCFKFKNARCFHSVYVHAGRTVSTCDSCLQKVLLAIEDTINLIQSWHEDKEENENVEKK